MSWKNFPFSFCGVVPLKVASCQVDFSWQRGGRYHLQGANGVGKSSFINWLGHESLRFQGEDKLSFCFQENHFFTPQAPASYFLSSLTQTASGEEIKSRQRELIDLFSFGPKLSFPIQELSGGQKQMMKIIGCLMFDVPLYILDEPFQGVHQEMVKKVFNFLQSEKEKTVLITSHQQLDNYEEMKKLVMTKGEGGLFLQEKYRD